MTEDHDIEPRPPVNLRTPISEAGLVISGLVDVWEKWDLPNAPVFWEIIFEELWANPETTGTKQFDELVKTENLTDWEGEPFAPGFKAAIIQIATMQVACAYAIQAFRAEKGSIEAWSYVCDAWHWLGILQGTISGRGMEKGLDAKKFSLAGLDARHSENRKMKADVFAWCDANMANYKSMDSAAEAIAGKEVPVTFRTARAWIADWKKTQSTGRA